MRFIFLLLVMPVLSSCDSYQTWVTRVDNLSFDTVGGTIFSSPVQVTTKELHFDIGKMIGRRVILEGQVISLDDQGTHMVLDDEFGRMLVVLTSYIQNEKLQIGADSRIKVLGSVARGKKGLPVIVAQSLNYSTNSGF